MINITNNHVDSPLFHPFELSNFSKISSFFDRLAVDENFLTLVKEHRSFFQETIFVSFDIVTFGVSFLTDYQDTGEYYVVNRCNNCIFLVPLACFGTCALSGETVSLACLTELDCGEDGKHLVKSSFTVDDLYCPECGTFLLDTSLDIIRTDDGSIYCSDDCATENDYRQCEDCGKWTCDTVYIDSESKVVCENCADDNYFRCENCGEYFSRDGDFVHAEDGSYFCCSDCAINSDYGTCDSCGEWHPINELNSNRNGYYCDSCYEDEEQEAKNLINSYSYSPDFTFYRGPDDVKGSTLFLGVEVETEFLTLPSFCAGIEDLHNFSNEFNELVYLKHDGSLDDYGVELVSMPCSLNWHKQSENQEKFMKLFGILSRHGADNSNACGMHVHLSRNGISEMHEIAIEMFFQVYAKRIQAIAGRDSCYYASYDISRNLENKEDFKAENCCRSRYRAVNWQNSRTVEFRVFASVVNYFDFLKNLEFCHAVYQFTKYTELDTIEKGDFSDFSNFVKSNATLYSNLAEII